MFSSNTSNPVRVLLISEHEDDYVFTRNLLAGAQDRFTLEWTNHHTNPIEAIVQSRHHAYLVDHCPGKQDGIKLAQAALSRGCRAPFILLVNGEYSAAIAAAVQAGASDVLVKNQLTANWLAHAIRHAIERKRAEKPQDDDVRHHLVTENMLDALWMLDLDFNIVFAGAIIERIWGYTPEELGVISLKKLLTPNTWATVLKVLSQELDRARRRQDPEAPQTLEIELYRKDGAVIWNEATITVIKDNQGYPMGFLGLGRDITERKQVEESTRVYAKRLETLHEIDRAILTSQSPEAIAREALNRLRGVVPCLWANVIEFDTTAQQGRVLATDRCAQTRFGTGTLIPMEAFSDELLLRHQAQILQDISASAHQPGLLRDCYEEGARAYLTLPLIAQQKLIGCLNLGADRPKAFTPNHIEIATEIAASLAVAIHQARLHEQAQRDAQTKTHLLQAVNHRVGNNLLAIRGFLVTRQRHAQAQQNTENYMLLKDLINQIDGMAAVHHLLSKSEWSPLLLSGLAHQVIHSSLNTLTSDEHVHVNVSPASVRVTPQQASSLASVINELTTNTLKYALRSRDIVQITVTITTHHNDVQMEFRDDGPGYPEIVVRQEHYNVGLYLVRGIVHNDLNGDIELYNDGGAVAAIRFKEEIRGGGTAL